MPEESAAGPEPANDLPRPTGLHLQLTASTRRTPNADSLIQAGRQRSMQRFSGN